MRGKFSYTLRIISTVVLSFFIWTFGGAFDIACAVRNDQQSVISGKPSSSGNDQQIPASSQRNQREQKPEERLQKTLEYIEQTLADTSIDTDTKNTRVKAKKADIDANDLEIKKQFKETEDRIKGLPEEIKKRHLDFVRNYESNLTTLKTNLDEIDKAKTDTEREQAHKKTKDFIEKVKPSKKHRKLDPNKLPHRSAEPVFKEPRTKPEEFTEGKALRAKGTVSKNILVAANGPLTGLLSENTDYKTTPDFLPYGSYQIALANPPTDADLAENIEVQFTPAITAKAAELGNNPVKIYNWVRNNIEYVPTYGSIQGANMCLQTKQCNDFDTASLLIALLRVSGIHARYVYGTIELPIEKVKNWVGGFTDSMEALKLLASAGVPTMGMTVGGEIKYVHEEHMFVEAYVVYDQYRGAKTTGSDKTWLPLDASYKEYEYVQGTDLFQVAGVDAQGFLNDIKVHSNYNENEASITNVDQSFLNQKIQDANSKIESYIQANMPNVTMPELLGYRKITTKEYSILLGSLPYKTVAVLSRTSAIPGNLRQVITFTASEPNFDDLTGELTYQATLPELTGKRVTLSYTAASDSDRAVISQYGDISAIPAYLVNLKPILRIAGKVVAEGPAFGLGSDLQFTMTFTNAKGSAEAVQNILPVGGYHAITINSSSIAKGSIQDIGSNFQALVNTINTGQGSLYPDDLMGEMLHSVGAMYFYEADALNKLTAKFSKVKTVKLPSEAITSLALKVSYMFSVPMKVKVTGLNIDVDRDIEASTSLVGDKNSVLAYRIQSGSNGSMMEHMIYENLFQIEGISAVKIVQIANQQGIPVYGINTANIAQILPNLQVSSSVMSDIQNFVNAGQTVTIPKQNISYNGWNGIGYIALDPNTGNGGYMIEGGSAGGDSTGPWVLGQAASALLAIADILKFGEALPVSKLLGAFAVIASVLGIVIDTMNNLSKIQEAKLSPDATRMLSALVIGISLSLISMIAIGLFFGPLGIAITALMSAYISMIFNIVIPDIILTAERIDNANGNH